MRVRDNANYFDIQKLWKKRYGVLWRKIYGVYPTFLSYVGTVVKIVNKNIPFERNVNFLQSIENMSEERSYFAFKTLSTLAHNASK